jgi:phosphoribosylformylglycinamidine synthase PurS subunit
MKYRVITMLRPGIKDNQGTAVAAALRGLGFPDVIDCRIGKMYDIEYTGDEIEKVAKNISNEVMENYTIEEIQ